MPDIFVNPQLPNYFISADEVVAGTSNRNYVQEYESGKIIVLPNVKPDVDFDFWAKLEFDRYPISRKLGSSVGAGNYLQDSALDRSLAASGMDRGLRADIKRHVARFYESLMPVYYDVFRGYEFLTRKAVWRTTTVKNENMHIDTYRTAYSDHFARMFVNIDSQPRIWQTSWTIDEITTMRARDFPPELLHTASANEIWSELSARTFGASSKIWWDQQPRHVIYFNPGDVWIVDSRQVSHQIFYGRRAVSIDFFVKPETMRNSERQYLRIAEEFRNKLLTTG